MTAGDLAEICDSLLALFFLMLLKMANTSLSSPGAGALPFVGERTLAEGELGGVHTNDLAID